MKIRIMDKDATIEVEVPYESPLKLPEIVYRMTKDGYKFYRKGFAANSTMYFEAEALHVPDQN